MQFALTKHQAKLTSFNPRAEKHGDENVPAGDLTFEVNAHSSALDQFGPTFRPFLFRKADSSGDQPTLALQPGDTLTSLAQPKLRPLVLDEDFPGYVLRIHTGMELTEPLVLGDAELSNFKFKAIEGGAVAITFSVTVHPDERAGGLLCQMIQDAVEISLEPPKAQAEQSAQQDLAA